MTVQFCNKSISLAAQAQHSRFHWKCQQKKYKCFACIDKLLGSVRCRCQREQFIYCENCKTFFRQILIVLRLECVCVCVRCLAQNLCVSILYACAALRCGMTSATMNIMLHVCEGKLHERITVNNVTPSNEITECNALKSLMDFVFSGDSVKR